MGVIESLQKRRTYYQIDKNLPVSEEKVVETIQEAVKLVPDAFNMKSQRVIVALGEKQNQLWDTVYDVFGGKVSREKIDGFRAGAGTVLYFTDESVVKTLQEKFPLYAANFPVWAQQSNGMLQISIWSALRELEIGANLQHYNPVINEAVRKLFDVRRTGSSSRRCRSAASWRSRGKRMMRKSAGESVLQGKQADG